MNRFVRTITAVSVLAVAAIAGVVSFSHIYDLGLTHGQSGVAARLLPLSVDGLIVACGLVLLHEARAHRPAIWQARLGLWSGIAATVTANVLYGVHYGPLGAILSGWPAYAFIIAAETMMAQIRRYESAPATAPLVGAGDLADDESPADPVADEPEPIEPAPAAELPPVPSSSEHAAEMAFRATHAAGNPLSGRQLEARFGLTRSQATKVRERVLGEVENEAQRRVRVWEEKHAPADDTAPDGGEPADNATADVAAA